MNDVRAGLQRRAYGMKVARDELGHDRMAEAVRGHITRLPAGSVISVQGPSGRGKTDVVTRVLDLFAEDALAGKVPQPVWIDPWQHGRPDLIQPIVIALLDRVPKGKDNDRLRKAAATLLRAADAMVFKAVSVVVPFGNIAGASQPAAGNLVDDVMKNADRQPRDADADPVHEMAVRFYELVDEVLSQGGSGDTSGQPLLICVDDLYRCPPDHQVVMLEAIHFLVSADANCSFLIALEPALVHQAIATHYRTDEFDSNQYLDKLFDLRVNLPALQPGGIGILVDAELGGTLGRQGAQPVATVLLEGLGAEDAAVKAAFEAVFCVPELTNPRLVRRVFERLCLAAAANAAATDAAAADAAAADAAAADAAAAGGGAGHAELRDPARLEDLVAWCAIAERWPELRQVLQASADEMWATNLTAICNFYGIWDRDDIPAEEKARALEEAMSITSRLPGKVRQPDLGDFIQARVLGDEGLLMIFRSIDDILVSFAL
jgi:hypothetical protein